MKRAGADGDVATNIETSPGRVGFDDRVGVVDHAVHGLAGIRLVDAPRHVVDALIKNIGPPQGNPLHEPDICVRFVDTLPRAENIRFLGRNSAAFDTENFYVLDQRGRFTRIPFEDLGEPCEILCERGVQSIPFIAHILGLRLLQKGHVLLHASSFVYQNKGIVVAGWEKGGKTETLLPFMAAGAYYIADERTIVSTDGTLRGLPRPVHLWEWHFRSLPEYYARVSGRDRQRMRLVRLYHDLFHRLPGAESGQALPLRLLRDIDREIALSGGITCSNEALFESRIWEGPAPLDRIFLAEVANGPTRVLGIQPEEVAQRMVPSLTYERRNLRAAYDQFRFAFPHRSNRLLEEAATRERDLLIRAFSGKPAHELLHPYPVPLDTIYQAAVPFCS